MPLRPVHVRPQARARHSRAQRRTAPLPRRQGAPARLRTAPAARAWVGGRCLARLRAAPTALTGRAVPPAPAPWRERGGGGSGSSPLPLPCSGQSGPRCVPARRLWLQASSGTSPLSPSARRGLVCSGHVRPAPLPHVAVPGGRAVRCRLCWLPWQRPR